MQTSLPILFLLAHASASEVNENAEENKFLQNIGPKDVFYDAIEPMDDVFYDAIEPKEDVFYDAIEPKKDVFHDAIEPKEQVLAGSIFRQKTNFITKPKTKKNLKRSLGKRSQRKTKFNANSKVQEEKFLARSDSGAKEIQKNLTENEETVESSNSVELTPELQEEVETEPKEDAEKTTSSDRKSSNENQPQPKTGEKDTSTPSWVYGVAIGAPIAILLFIGVYVYFKCFRKSSHDQELVQEACSNEEVVPKEPSRIIDSSRLRYATALNDEAMSNIDELKVKLKDHNFGEEILEVLESFGDFDLDELVREMKITPNPEKIEIEDFTAKSDDLQRLGETVVAKMNDISDFKS